MGQVQTEVHNQRTGTTESALVDQVDLGNVWKFRMNHIGSIERKIQMEALERITNTMLATPRAVTEGWHRNDAYNITAP